MSMLRHYYISEDLDDLEVFEEQLESAGIATPQIHVLSRDDNALAHHAHLHEVQSFMKKDIVHWALIGVVVGACIAALVLSVAYLAGWTQTVVGWIPFIFLAIVVLGFSTWEGGLYGVQKPNHHFARFEDALREGKHVFFVDLDPKEEAVLSKTLQSHPRVVPAGTEATSSFQWLVSLMSKRSWVQHS